MGLSTCDWAKSYVWESKPTIYTDGRKQRNKDTDTSHACRCGEMESGADGQHGSFTGTLSNASGIKSLLFSLAAPATNVFTYACMWMVRFSTKITQNMSDTKKGLRYT